MKVRASAPSNIALIKYMGKSSYDVNLPSNSSLSWTLDHLRTEVELELVSKSEDLWEPLLENGIEQFELNEKSVQRFLGHLKRMKIKYDLDSSFVVRSNNNFPKDSGLASSASSFAALTMAFGEVLSNLGHSPSAEELSQVSRVGSGSSCRSFFGPWCLWNRSNGSVESIELPVNNLDHLAFVVSSESKKVSSSEAHKRVTSSPLFNGRADRAEMRLEKLMTQFRHDDWRGSYETIKSEFWDMMGLFHTSEPTFSYLKPLSIEVLNHVDEIWEKTGDGPLVTMDAGPNIHLLFRNDQRDVAEKILESFSKLSSHTSWSR